MIALAVMMTWLSGVFPPVQEAPVCAVARAALRDLPNISRYAPGDRYYDGRSDTYHRDVLEVCPMLRDALPPAYPLASDAVRASVGEIASPPRPVSVFAIEVPVLNARANRAIVRMSYSCTGLCGAGFEATYVLTRKGWRRQGEPRGTWVS
jgi:hypothetical protein